MKRIKNYDLIQPVGHGHSAEVYQAIDTHTGQQVAIKFRHDYFTDDSNKQTFLHEAHFMARLNHPAIY
jgi:serine/threonine protein kinase